MKIILNLLLFIFLFGNAFAEDTDTVSLNEEWKFKTDLKKQGNSEEWFKPSVKKDNWDNIRKQTA